MNRFWKNLWRKTEGQGLSEYALLLALISLIGTVAVASFGLSLHKSFVNEAAEVTSVSTPSSGSGSASSSASGSSSGTSPSGSSTSGSSAPGTSSGHSSSHGHGRK